MTSQSREIGIGSADKTRIRNLKTSRRHRGGPGCAKQVVRSVTPDTGSYRTPRPPTRLMADERRECLLMMALSSSYRSAHGWEIALRVMRDAPQVSFVAANRLFEDPEAGDDSACDGAHDADFDRLFDDVEAMHVAGKVFEYHETDENG